jgi:RND family efflux transporter MFP subunit
MKVGRRLSVTLPACVALLPFLLGGCGDNNATEAAPSAEPRAVSVTIAEARQQEVRVELFSVGRLISLNAPQLAAETDGRVVDVLVEEGDTVVQGQELILLDTTALELSRREAEAEIQRLQVSIANEERRVTRYRDLKTRDVMPQERLDDAEAQLAGYRASLEAAEARLAIVGDRLRKARYLSPVNGVVERRHVSIGDFVKVGAPLLTVTDTVALHAELPFPETVGAQIRLGQTLYIRSPLAPDLQVEAQVDQIRPQVGTMNRSLLVVADIINPGPWRPQATIEARIVVERRPGAIIVPLLSVVQRPAGQVVYVLDQRNGGTVRQQLVETGVRRDGWIEIRSGVEPGTPVVAEGAHYLTDGAAVNVAEEA